MACALTVALLCAGLVAAGAAEQGVTIRGKDLYLDRKPWLPKGVKVEVFNRPSHVPVTDASPDWLNKHPENRSWWNPAERRAMRPTPRSGCNGAATPELSVALLRYLAKLNIGLIGWAVDTQWPTLVKSHDDFQPTDFSAFTGCNDGSNAGGGKLLAAYPKL